MKHSKTKLMIKFFLSITAAFIMLSCSYMPIGGEVPDGVLIEEGRDYIVYESATGSSEASGLIFYPGGLIEPNAYDLMLSQFAQEGYKVVLAKMPLNLAVLKPLAAFKLMDRYPEIDQWVIAGHSLGGAMACKAVAKRPDAFSGLVLLAAYPDDKDDLSSWDGAVLSVSGSEDLITTPQEIQDSKMFLPEAIVINTASEIPNSSTASKTVYYEIEGANHAQFGNYGPQDDDGEATISAEEQLFEIKNIVSTFWEVNQW